MKLSPRLLDMLERRAALRHEMSGQPTTEEFESWPSLATLQCHSEFVGPFGLHRNANVS